MGKKPTSSRANITESFSTIIGISLVLTMIGLLSIVIFVVRKKNLESKDRVNISIMMKEDATETEVFKFKKSLESEDYSKSSKFFSKEEAAQIMRDKWDMDISLLGDDNPLPFSIDLVVQPNFTRVDSLEWIAHEIEKNSIVKEAVYHPDAISEMNRNFGKISLALLIFSAILLIIAIALINNTIRLAIFSKRFTIKSMQLVGATNSFIRRPIIMKGISYGIISGIIAIAFLLGIVYLLRNQLSEIPEIIFDNHYYIPIGILVLGTGILLSWIFTNMAVNRFIRLDQNQLY